MAMLDGIFLLKPLNLNSQQPLKAPWNIVMKNS